MALVICLLQAVIISVAGTIVPGLGAFIVTGPLTFGISAVFLQTARTGGDFEIGDMFKGFTENIGDNIVIGVLVSIFTSLWSLLFVIPGIVKSYSYAMAYYIKKDNPGMSGIDCITASRKLMKGHKAELFVLDLSFIGWNFVGSLCFGFGILWVVPYHEASRAQFYNMIASQPQILK